MKERELQAKVNYNINNVRYGDYVKLKVNTIGW